MHTHACILCTPNRRKRELSQRIHPFASQDIVHSAAKAAKVFRRVSFLILHVLFFHHINLINRVESRIFSYTFQRFSRFLVHLQFFFTDPWSSISFLSRHFFAFSSIPRGWVCAQRKQIFSQILLVWVSGEGNRLHGGVMLRLSLRLWGDLHVPSFFPHGRGWLSHSMVRARERVFFPFFSAESERKGTFHFVFFCILDSRPSSLFFRSTWSLEDKRTTNFQRALSFFVCHVKGGRTRQTVLAK